MATKKMIKQPFNIVIIGQGGRLQYEALIFLASLRTQSPDFNGKVFIAEPQDGPLWPQSPVMHGEETLELLTGMGAEILPFQSQHFGQAYPYGNKIEALFALPKGEPFVFFDTDTLILDDLTQVPFDFARPSASMKRENTWPEIELYGPGYSDTWKSLYDQFDLEFDSSLDLSWPDEFWRRYLYFNAGFFYYKCPHEFGQRFLDYALTIRDNPPPELVCQSLDPWLDQVALPLVIHSFGGGRDSAVQTLLDHDVTCHYRVLALLYATEKDRTVEVLEQVTAPNKIKKVLKNYDPIKRMIFQKRGHKVRDLFDRENLPRKQQAIRNLIKRNGFWMR